MKVEDVTMSVANLALQFGDDDAKVWIFLQVLCMNISNLYTVIWFQASMSRPFGVALLFAGVDQEGPKLFVFTAAIPFLVLICKLQYLHPYCQLLCFL